MTLNEYQTEALKTAIFPQRHELGGMMYLGLGLAGEVGEIVDHIKKIFRDDDGEISPDRRRKMILEMGDAQWYLAVLAEFLGATLESVAQQNVEKLASRMRRGKLGGSGDDR